MLKVLLKDEDIDNFNLLFNKFINIESNFSEEHISSHWKYYLPKTLIRYDRSKNEVLLHQAGFDDYKENNLKNYLIDIPKKIYLNKLIKTLPSNILNNMYKVINLQRRLVSFNCVKNAIIIDHLIKYRFDFNKLTVCIIGDGNGFLGILLKSLFPDIKIVQINLGKILIYDFLFTSLSDIFGSMEIIENNNKEKDIFSDCVFIPAEDVFDIEIDHIDFFFNVASMQEMNTDTIEKYFNFMRKQKTNNTFFYCCNRVSKKLFDNSYSNFDEYNWLNSDSIIFDEICEWYNKAPISRPPFAKKFDGISKHKLIKF